MILWFIKRMSAGQAIFLFNLLTKMRVFMFCSLIVLDFAFVVQLTDLV